MRIPLMAFIVLLLLSVAIDFYIYRDIRRHLERKKRIWATGYAVTSVMCVAFLVVIFFLPRRDADSSVVPIMWMLYSYLTVYVAKIVYLIVSLLGRLFNFIAQNRVNFSLFMALPVAVLAFFSMWWGSLVTVRETTLTHVTVSSPKLPKTFDGYRIVQFSDAHVGTWGNDTTFISRLVDEINRQNPDAIFFTGDIVNRQSEELEPFVKVLSRLKARDGVYSVMGNHDYGDYITWDSDEEKAADRKRLKEMQKRMGWKMLNNERTFIVSGNDSLPLIGVENWGEPPFSQYGRLTDAYPLSKDSAYNLNDRRFKILLTHNPEHWSREVTEMSDIDLTLSGHTHAMQLMLSGFGSHWSPAKYKYGRWGGLYKSSGPQKDPQYLNVNIGCGEVGVPMRIGAVPEITLITLKTSKYPEASSDF